jgi:chemotaxis-related protein WspB
MLCLLFELGNARYALDASQVIEVLPLLDAKRVPKAISGMSGLFNYHGSPTPLFDLTELILGMSSQLKMSSRIIVTSHVEESGERHLIGFIAERVTETMRCAETDFVRSGVSVEAARFLGPVFVQGDSIIQQVDVRHLLSDSVRSQIFAELAG